MNPTGQAASDAGRPGMKVNVTPLESYSLANAAAGVGQKRVKGRRSVLGRFSSQLAQDKTGLDLPCHLVGRSLALADPALPATATVMDEDPPSAPVLLDSNVEPPQGGRARGVCETPTELRILCA